METVYGQMLSLRLGNGDEHRPLESNTTGLNVKRNLYLGIPAQTTSPQWKPWALFGDVSKIFYMWKKCCSCSCHPSHITLSNRISATEYVIILCLLLSASETKICNMLWWLLYIDYLQPMYQGLPAATLPAFLEALLLHLYWSPISLMILRPAVSRSIFSVA